MGALHTWRPSSPNIPHHSSPPPEPPATARAGPFFSGIWSHEGFIATTLPFEEGRKVALVNDCPLCDSALGPVIFDSFYWRTVLNRNQNLLGKCFIALRRHADAVIELTTDEWTDLHGQISRLSHSLDAVFRPDHVNLAFLQNQDRHVHLHVIPRYAGVREFAGLTFTDPRFGDHYDPAAPPILLPSTHARSLVARLRSEMEQASGGGHVG